MLKPAVVTIILVFAVLAGIVASVALAGGLVPAVNTDMACSSTGQTLQYSGSVLVCGGAPKIPSTVVGSLPTCNAGAAGLTYVVTDSLLPVALAIVTNGGAVVVSVFCNGTNWIVQ